MNVEQRLALAFLESHPTHGAAVLERMPPGQRDDVIRQVPAEAAAAAMREMVAAAAADSLSHLAPAEAGGILDALELETAAALLRRLSSESAGRLVGTLRAERQEAIRRVLRYPDGTAGAVMDPSVPALPDDLSIAEARLRLRRAAPGLLYYLYVVDRSQHLVGVLDIPDLMRARAKEAVRSVMRSPVESMSAWLPAAGVRTHPGWRRFHAMPVVDDTDRLVGAVRYQTLRRLEQEAEAAAAVQPAVFTVAALGELFHLGMAGFVEGVSAVAVARGRTSGDAAGSGEREKR
jgi:magnesium transporter